MARLRRLVDTVREARPAGSALALIAHGPAGHVARAVASSSGSGVTHLTTYATAHVGSAATWADEPAAGDGLRLLQALRQLSNAAPGDLAEADDLLILLAGLSDGPPPPTEGSLAVAGYPLADVGAPPGLVPLPTAVAATTVAAELDAATIDLALGRLVGELIRARSNPAGLPEHLAVGIRARLADVAADVDLRVKATATLDLLTLPLDFGADDATASERGPQLRVDVRLDRPAGWLVGGPAGAFPATRRDPRLRAVDLAVIVDLRAATARAQLVLHDAAVFGLERARWEVALSDDAASGLPAHLTPELRVLLGELAHRARDATRGRASPRDLRPAHHNRVGHRRCRRAAHVRDRSRRARAARRAHLAGPGDRCHAR